MPNKTRQELIDAGRIWQVYPAVNREHILFEGTETKCRKEIKEKYQRQNRSGEIRLAKVIWESESVNQ